MSRSYFSCLFVCIFIYLFFLPAHWSLSFIIARLYILCITISQCLNSLGGGGGWITSSRDRDHPGQHGETPYLLKIQKISWAWWHVPVIPASQEAEAGEWLEPKWQRLQVAVSRDCATALQPGWQSENLSQKNKKIKDTILVRIQREVVSYWWVTVYIYIVPMEGQLAISIKMKNVDSHTLIPILKVQAKTYL